MNKIALNSFLYLAGELLSKFIPFLMLPYLTRMLNVDGFGELSLYQSYQSIFLIFICWSFEGAVTRYYFRYGTHAFGHVIMSSFLLILLLFFIVLPFLPSPLFKIIWCAAALQALLNICLGVFQCKKKPIPYISIQFILATSSATFTLLAFHFIQTSAQMRIEANLLALFLTTVLVMIFIFRFENTRPLFKFNKKILIYIIGFGFPLLFHQLSFYFKGQFDRIIISDTFTLAELGIYSAGFQIASIFSILLMALQKAYSPFFYEGCKTGKINSSTILKYTLLSLTITPCPAIFAYITPQAWYVFLLGSEYAQAKYFTTIFLLGLSMQIPYLILVTRLFYLGKSTQIALCTFSSSILHIFLLYVLQGQKLRVYPYVLLISNFASIILLFIYTFKLSKNEYKFSREE